MINLYLKILNILSTKFRKKITLFFIFLSISTILEFFSISIIFPGLSLILNESSSISFLNNEYLNRNKLKVEDFGRGFAWLDMGTHDSLLEASQFIKTIEKQQGLKVGCLEEIGYRNGWITLNNLVQSGESLKHTSYGKYIMKLTSTL